MRAALHTVWLLATAILGAESDRETVYSYLSKSVSDDGAEVPLHLRSHPILKLALGDMVGFVGSDFSLLELEDGGGGDDDSLWLVHQLASRLAGGVKAGAVSQLDMDCFESPSHEICCPSPEARPPRLPTQFLTETFDAMTKLVIFFDNLGFFELSLNAISVAKNLCPGTGLEFREAFMTRTVDSSFESMLANRELLLEKLDSFDTEVPPIDDLMKAVDMEWSSTPPTMMLGYQFIDDHTPLRKIADIYRKLYPELSVSHVTEEDVERLRNSEGEKNMTHYCFR
ncbi:hypothetical protein TrVE_jg4920 [Triparma verrucosa]|uniref:Uncharacterized protein n=1 Tax=Triparma verrucosa TaxID=1606542 RepID=A0A9W7BQ14_9STRA|nr:hypothetical protein TrVE_jg4920 [Triparma verrucosa]